MITIQHPVLGTLEIEHQDERTLKVSAPEAEHLVMLVGSLYPIQETIGYLTAQALVPRDVLAAALGAMVWGLGAVREVPEPEPEIPGHPHNWQDVTGMGDPERSFLCLKCGAEAGPDRPDVGCVA
jgi:tetrahydromethanopterin S-methyltransferase subunit C